MPTQRIAFKDWLPDQSSILDTVSEANNVIPLAVGYGPLKSSVDYSQSASENLNNVFSTKYGNDVKVFAGGNTKLFLLDSTDLTLDDVTRAAGAYTGDSKWQFAQFGSYALAANGAQKIQYYDVTSSTQFADLAASAPIAKYITIVRDFIVSGYINAGTNANRVQWSDINDPSDWTPGAASQSDFQDLPDGGDITGMTGGEFGIIFLEKAIVRMSYIGSPLFFQFDTISRNIGCIEGNSIAQYGGTSYFLSDDGFYSTNGQTLTGIGSEKVDRYFFSNANIGDIDTISAAVDPERTLIIWNYGNISGGRSLIIYNFETQKWSSADTDVDYLSTLATSGISLDGLDSAYNVTAGSFVATKQYTIRTVGTTNFTLIGAVANTVGVLFTATGAGTGTGVAIDMAASAAGLKTLDTIVTNLDDRLYKGGKFLFGGVKDTKIVTFTGTNTTGSIITNDLEYGYNSVINLVRPSVDNGSASISVASRRMLDDTITYGSSVTASQEDRCSVRSAGRYHRIALTPTGANWSSAIGMDIDYSEQGSR